MSGNSERAGEYRKIVEDVAANRALLDDDEWMQLGDLLKRVERKVRANMPARSKDAA